MLVNASFTPGDFYVDTVKGLCPSTTYEFAAWVMNVLRTSACQGNGIDPNLTFKIETTTGTVLASYNTGNLQEEAVAVHDGLSFLGHGVALLSMDRVQRHTVLISEGSEPTGQNWYWSMFSAVKTVGGPRTTSPSVPIVYSLSLPALNFSPSAPVIWPDASDAAA